MENYALQRKRFEEERQKKLQVEAEEMLKLREQVADLVSEVEWLSTKVNKIFSILGVNYLGEKITDEETDDK